MPPVMLLRERGLLLNACRTISYYHCYYYYHHYYHHIIIIITEYLCSIGTRLGAIHKYEQSAMLESCQDIKNIVL